MAVFAGTSVVKDTSLVLNLDPANSKSLPRTPGAGEHGYADWYCFVAATVTYSIISAGVTIYSKDANGVTAVVVSTSTAPTRGTFVSTAGYTYYSTGGPINLVAEDFQHAIVPVTMAGTQFVNIFSWGTRFGVGGYIYFYAPTAAATVKYYEGGTGISSATAITTVSLAAGQSSYLLSLTTATYYFLSSTTPIIASSYYVNGGADKTILSPAGRTVYQRYVSYYLDMNNNSSGFTVTNNVVASTSTNVMGWNIADGAGGDTAQGISIDNLSDTYSWGNTLSDYEIISPYPNTTVTVSYYTGTNWVAQETHVNTTATTLSPWVETRDGTNGVGNSAGIINGTANNFNASTLWKWEGNKPFALFINDSTDDEFAVLGWLSNQNQKILNPASMVWNDISSSRAVGQGWTGSIQPVGNAGNTPTLSTTASGSLVFNSAASHRYEFSQNANLNIVNNLTIESWVYMNSFNSIGGIVTLGTTGGEQYALWTGVGGYLVFSTNWPNTFWYQAYSGVLTTGKWYHSIVTFSNGNWAHYINSNVSTTGTFTATNLTTVTNAYLMVGDNHPGGQEYFDGQIGSIKIYNRVLNTTEIQQNYQALRDRYGI